MEDRLLELLESGLGKSKKTSGDNYAFYSPFVDHYKPKLEVNIRITSDGQNPWHCWISDEKGRSIKTLFKKLRVSKQTWDEYNSIFSRINRYVHSDNQIQVNQVELPKEFKPMWENGSGIIQKHSWVYLQNRGITKADVMRYGIGYCSEGLYSNRVIIPSYDAKGELNYFVGRSIYKEGMKYKNPPISKNVIGFELFINWDEPIILCEGVFDAIAIKRNVIPLFGKTIPKKLMKKIYEKQVKTIYILLDSDAYWDSIKMTDVLMRNGIDVQLIRLKDKDPSEMGFTKVIDVIKKSSKTSFSDLIRMKLNGKTKKYMEI